MNLTFVPQRRDDALVLERRGDALIVNGTVLDFGPLPEGAALPRGAVDCPWLVSDVLREGGRIRLTLILPVGAGAPESAWTPAPLIDPPDGPLALPTTRTGEDAA